MKRGVVVLTGGVGGAKLVLGLTQIMPPEEIACIVNTGDDFRHLGLTISPDIDTLLYTLAGIANPATGWGREGESWSFMGALRTLGGPQWFKLGDGDLALHVLRTQCLAGGQTLSAVTADFARAWGLRHKILPMSDERVSTVLETSEGPLPFQEYFVARRCEPVVRHIRFEGLEKAKPAPGVLGAIAAQDTRAILIAPSNPYLSIDPILAVPGMRQALTKAVAPVIAVTPIVGGKAVKGPTAKLMGELGKLVTPATIADHYAGMIDGLLVDERDSSDDLKIAHQAADTLMLTLTHRVRVAQAALDFADHVAR